MNFVDIFQNYLLYPDLVAELVDYFDFDDEYGKKSVADFCHIKAKPIDNSTSIYTVLPELAVYICEILCKHNYMFCTRNESVVLGHVSYSLNIFFSRVWKEQREEMIILLNSLIYGFEFIYHYYMIKEIIVPIVQKSYNSETKSEKYSLGTGVKINNGILTAKHCLENATSIAIKGFSKSQLNGREIIISGNANIDIAFITDTGHHQNAIKLMEGRVAQDILVMGYPRLAGYHEFLTAEKGMISAAGKIEERFTSTKGSIAALGKSIFSKEEMLLVTAKISGGSSGGPIINQFGYIVGIACSLPCAEGDYENLGYGAAISTKTIIDVINKQEDTLCISPNLFVDFDSI